ncbi:AraC family transcriptional regulator [Bacillus sp. JCM 19041]|uniref:AraC family transcriptional regulator n=1 Tax=Bacillus sp. JCM 19041 TaxID=1460637 RepID=UPI0012E1317F
MNFAIDERLRELTNHQTVSLPVACYKTTIRKHIQGHIPLHWHDEIQLVYMVKGNAIFQVNEAKIRVLEGDGLFLNSGCLHMAEAEDSASAYLCLNVSSRFLLSHELYSTYVHPYIQSTNVTSLHVPGKEDWGKAVLSSINDIYESLQHQESFYEIDVSVQLAMIWRNVIAHTNDLKYEQTEIVKNERMKQMIDYIHSHYTEKVTLAAIAQAGQLSRAECCRYFKRVLHTSPLSYVIDYRIQKSLFLLQQDELNVTEVGYQVGFNSTSYFIGKFREGMKMTPLAYKKEKAKH